MSSLIQQLQNSTNAAAMQLTVQPDSKKQNTAKKLTVYGTAVPVFAAAGGYFGYDSFQKEKEYLKKALDVRVDGNIQNFRNHILSNFADLVLRIKEGRSTEMPNCLLIKGNDPEYCERIINWIGKTSNSDFIPIKIGDDILSHLEKAEENFQRTKNWTLLYVKNMDKLIDHNEVQDNIVEGMKDIMSAAAEDYHTTIIFSSAHPEKLDKIALQPHRVKRVFDINKIDENKFFETDKIIQNWNKNNDRYEQLINNKSIKNSKIAKFSVCGLIAGAGIAALINSIVNKNKK